MSEYRLVVYIGERCVNEWQPVGSWEAALGQVRDFRRFQRQGRLRKDCHARVQTRPHGFVRWTEPRENAILMHFGLYVFPVDAAQAAGSARSTDPPSSSRWAYQCPGCWSVTMNELKSGTTYECECGERLTLIDLRQASSLLGEPHPHPPLDPLGPGPGMDRDEWR